jgi:hypothetical protein
MEIGIEMRTSGFTQGRKPLLPLLGQSRRKA